jgi:type IV pilus assembly protein PilX
MAIRCTKSGLVRRQRGAVLFVALVFLILLTLLALTASGTSILQEKMTGGMRNRQLGLMGAESALRGGEAFFTNANFSGQNPLPPCDSTSARICAYRPQNGILRSEVQTYRSSKASVAALGGAPAYTHVLTGLSGDIETASLAVQPEFIVEDLGADVPPGIGQQHGIIDPEQQNSAWFYRITARSQGGSGAVMRVTESVYSPGLNLANAGANTP